MARNMDDVDTRNKKQWSDGVQQFKWTKMQWHRVRFFGLTYSDFRHNVETKSKKVYYEYCHAYDSNIDDFLSDREQRCAACALDLSGSMRYFMNLINLDYEAIKPAVATPDWSPIFLAEIPKSLFEKLQSYKPLNKNYPVNHPQHGAIVNVMYNPDADATAKYSLSLDEKDVPITKEQAAYQVFQTINGERKVINGKDGLPGAFVYIRTTSSAQELKRGLKLHGYYGEGDGAESKSYESEYRTTSDVESEEETGAKAMVDTKTQEVRTLPKKPVKLEEEIPFSPPKTKPVETGSTTDTTLNISPECPDAFGKFSGAHICFMKCKARIACRQATEAAKKNEVTKPEEDDDAV